MVALGTLDEDGIFYAQEVLAKHDETYMAPSSKRLWMNKKPWGHLARPVGLVSLRLILP